MNKLKHLLTIIGFMVTICLPSTIWLSQTEQEISIKENRRLASLPVLTFTKDSISSFPKRFNSYFIDHFGLRGKLLTLNFYLKKYLFNKSSVTGVIPGLENWLFLDVDESLKDHLGASALTTADLENWQTHLTAKSAWLNNLGIQYFLVAIPNKMSLYPEFLPKRIQHNSSTTMMDQLHAALENQTAFKNYLNLEPFLQEQKQTKLKNHLLTSEKKELYFQHDTHWTSHTSFLAYQHTIKKLQAILPKLEEPLSELNVSKREVDHLGDIARMTSIKDKEQDHQIIVKEPCSNKEFKSLDNFKETTAYQEQESPKELPVLNGCNEKQLKAVIVHDSFGLYQRKFFAENFKEVIFMTPYDFIGMESFLKEFKPDVYIDMRVERNIKKLLSINIPL